MLRLALLALLFLSIAGRGMCQDDIQAVGAVWNDFVSSLRRGDYTNAHGLFSPESRAVMPYAEFVAEYGPLSAAREMVLAKPESLATNVGDDWAEITYGGTNPGTGKKFKVGVALVKNRGGWGLVAARNEAPERVEAGARGLLRMVWAARDKGTPRELVAALNAAHAKNPLMQYYRIETDGAAIRAFPLERGLRTFYLEGSGVVRAVGEGEPEPRRLPAEAMRVPERSALSREEPPKPDRPALENGMPELSEPPPRGGRGAAGAAQLDEFAEPPMPGGSRGRERPNVALPDTIR